MQDAGNRQSYDIIFLEPRFNRWCRKILNTCFEKVVHNGIILHRNSVLTDRSLGSVYEAMKANEVIYSEYCEGQRL